MKLRKSGANTTVIAFPRGEEVLFSYQTAVAAFVPGRGYIRTEVKYSVTTSKHINKWLDGVKATAVPQEWIDDIVTRGEAI